MYETTQSGSILYLVTSTHVLTVTAQLFMHWLTKRTLPSPWTHSAPLQMIKNSVSSQDWPCQDILYRSVVFTNCGVRYRTMSCGAGISFPAAEAKPKKLIMNKVSSNMTTCLIYANMPLWHFIFTLTKTTLPKPSFVCHLMKNMCHCFLQTENQFNYQNLISDIVQSTWYLNELINIFLVHWQQCWIDEWWQAFVFSLEDCSHKRLISL